MNRATNPVYIPELSYGVADTIHGTGYDTAAEVISTGADAAPTAEAEFFNPWLSARVKEPGPILPANVHTARIPLLQEYERLRFLFGPVRGTTAQPQAITMSAYAFLRGQAETILFLGSSDLAANDIDIPAIEFDVYPGMMVTVKMTALTAGTSTAAVIPVFLQPYNEKD